MASFAQAPPDSVTPFNKVPLEIFLRVANHLTTTELCSLRLTCRSIERSLFTTFSREFFSKKQFMLTEDSLQALIDISTSRIADCLKHVIIGLDCYKKGIPVDSQLKNTKYTAGYDDQQTLLWNGQAVLMLAEAFRNLQPTVVAMRDYASEARQHRDGSRARWASYGATTAWRETGVSLIGGAAFDENVSIYATQVFAMLLAALASSGASPTAIEILRHHGGGLRPTAFNIPKYLEPSLLPVLSKLETIFLPVSIVPAQNRWGNTAPARFVAADQSNQNLQDCPDYLLRIFLAHLPNLKHLRINFRRHDVPTEFIRWLAAPVPDASQFSHPPAAAVATQVPPLPPPVAFAHLENLEFGILTIDPETILAAIRKFAPTLKGVDLWKVTLKSHNSDTHGQLNRNNVWKQFLGRLRHVPGLKLKHMMIGQPFQQGLHSTRYDVLFTSLTTKGGVNIVQRRAYQGNEWDEWIQDVQADVTVVWPLTEKGDDGPADSEESELESDNSEADETDEDLLMASEEWDDWMDEYDAYEFGAALEDLWTAGFSPSMMP